MTITKINNLKAMKKVADKKSNYGVSQIKVNFSSKSKLMNDNKAVYGKRVLREKIYSKI